MSQPIFSKHLRIKAYRTPIIEELINYSRSRSKPKQNHLDKLVSVWRNLSGNEQCNYHHIPDMSIDLSRYLVSQSNSPTSPLKNRHKLSRSGSSTRIKKSFNSPKVLESISFSKDSLSTEAKNLAISAGKNRFDEVSLRPKYLQELEMDKNSEHKRLCNCKQIEVPHRMIFSNALSENKIFISCKFAASDFPELLRNRIHAILTVGEEPKFYPAIIGGYCNVQYDGVNFLRPFQQVVRFFNAKLKVGNVLIHCETGNKGSIFLLMAYLLKESKLTFRYTFDMIKRIRPTMQITQKEEIFLKRYDSNQ